jgi:hypothetical protein
MTDTMTPPPEATPPMPEGAAPMPEAAPVMETPGATPPSVADTPMTPPGAEAPDAEAPEGGAPDEGDEGMAPPPEDGTPTFPGQKLKHTGEEGKIEKIADDYVIPLSDEAMSEWAKAKDEKGFKAYAEQVACGLYPTFAPQIQMGLPTRVLLDPYVQVAQQVLGSMMSEPNWSDAKWNQALQGGTDPKTGRPIPMTLDEWRKFLMKEPGHNYEQSPQALETAHTFGKALNDAFNGRQPAEMPDESTSQGEM